jgi:hypothetical protein
MRAIGTGTKRRVTVCSVRSMTGSRAFTVVARWDGVADVKAQPGGPEEQEHGLLLARVEVNQKAGSRHETAAAADFAPGHRIDDDGQKGLLGVEVQPRLAHVAEDHASATVRARPDLRLGSGTRAERAASWRSRSSPAISTIVAGGSC